QQHIVGEEQRLARYRLEAATAAYLRRPQSEEHERTADDEYQKGKDENASARIGGERMHRSQHARTNEERAEERQREGADREQHGPRLERPALFRHRERMNERGADEPRHERRILDRIPEPPAAPAQLVIRPCAAEHDAAGEK